MLDVGVKETYLEFDMPEGITEFYQLVNPSPLTLLVMKISAGLLGEWGLIIPGDDAATWEKLKAYFKGQHEGNISTRSGDVDRSAVLGEIAGTGREIYIGKCGQTQ